MKTDLVTKYRFPVVFGVFLLASYFGFSKRHLLMGDIAEQKSSLFKVNEENRKIIDAAKRSL